MKIAKKRKPRTTPTVTAYRKRLDRFLDVLAEYGIESRAAKAAKLDLRQLRQERDNNPVFAAEWNESARIGDTAIHDEIRRRALFGDVYEKVIRGKKVKFRRKSDKLLMFLAKSIFPEYRNDPPQVKIVSYVGIQQEPNLYPRLKELVRANAEAREAQERANGKYIESEPPNFESNGD